MTEVVNLNKFRKVKKRGADQQSAKENRRLHGRTKAEKAKDQAEKSGAENKLDGRKITTPETDPNSSE